METNPNVFTLEKMSAIRQENQANKVEYFLEMSSNSTEKVSTRLRMNDFLGKKLTLTHTGTILCLNCEKKTKKSFNQGYCYPCFIKLAACDMCIMKPETCHFAAGTCREPEWGEKNCNIDHIVYLANSSGLKVGITRSTQIPVRWIDQGAVAAIPLFKVKTRYHSGLLEVAIKKYVADKTHWQKMLRGEEEAVNLLEEREKIFTLVEKVALELGAEFLRAEPIQTFVYPVLEYPKKVKSHSLEKEMKVEGTLMGIKGQYLIFDSGVINLRKYGGYQITIS
ncbi:MAG: DUF2797 domain-containing protein [Bacteriovoracaceae bacterium]